MIVIKVFDNTVGVLLICEKHFHYRIISLKWDVCAHRTNFSMLLVIEISVPSQEMEWLRICELGASNLHPSMMFLFNFGTA